MHPRTALGVLAVLAPTGWLLACVFGVLVCFLSLNAAEHQIAWQILTALVLGSMLSVFPIGLSAFVAVAAFTESKEGGAPWHFGANVGTNRVSWRWTTFLALCGLELLVFPLTLVAGAVNDDTFLLSIPFNATLLTLIAVVGCWPHRQKAAVVICAIHILGMLVATVAAAIEIESVVVTGFILMLTGIALASVGVRPHALRLGFALSSVAFIIGSFLVIAIGGVSQYQAESPLYAAMVTYQIFFTPLGLLLIYREVAARPLLLSSQFGLKQLIAVMALVCIAAALGRAAHSNETDLRLVVALAVSLLTLGGMAAAIAGGGWNRWIHHSELHT